MSDDGTDIKLDEKIATLARFFYKHIFLLITKVLSDEIMLIFRIFDRCKIFQKYYLFFYTKVLSDEIFLNNQRI